MSTSRFSHVEAALTERRKQSGGGRELQAKGSACLSSHVFGNSG